MEDTFINWDFGWQSRCGKHKEENEDRLLLKAGVEGESSLVMAVLADGMGGYTAGARASGLAIKVFQDWWESSGPRVFREMDFERRLSEEVNRLLQHANREIMEYAQSLGKKMGTTVSVLFVYGNCFLVFNVGDGRVYRVSTNNYVKEIEATDKMKIKQSEQAQTEACLEQLTEDHTWVARQVKKGLIDKEQARFHPYRNVLIYCLGIDENFEVYSSSGTCRPGEIFLVCSDGFYGMFSSREIAGMVDYYYAQQLSTQEVTDQMSRVAWSRETHDDFSLLLIRRK